MSKLPGDIPKNSISMLEKNMKIRQADFLAFSTTEDPPFNIYLHNEI